MDCTQRTSGNRLRIALIAIAAVTVGAIISYFFTNHTHTGMSATQSLFRLVIPSESTHKDPNAPVTQTIAVQQNDTLASVFHRANLPNTLWMTIINLPEASKTLERLEIGQLFKITSSPTHELLSMTYDVDAGETLQIEKHDTHYIEKVTKRPVTKVLQFKSAVIHHNLQQAANAAGLPKNLEKELLTMFANSQFAHHIRSGEHLEVLYHEYFVNNQADRTGNIVAAQITDGQHHYRLVRYTTPNHEIGYYKPNGEGTKPTFLRYPLHYQRIGSQFNYHRYDPVLHRIHPHLGVDFDAPTGTPVKAISDGVVVMAKQVRGYGNVLMIRYNQTYKTLYAHLEKFARHTRINERVKKGEVVGYVGTTGWSTGPHLHFSVFKNGVAVNPLTVDFPKGSPVPEKYRREFFYKTNHWFTEMNLFEEAALADNQKNTNKKQA